MSRNGLVLVIVLLALALGGAVAYSLYERDQNTLDITVGKDGVKVD